MSVVKWVSKCKGARSTHHILFLWFFVLRIVVHDETKSHEIGHIRGGVLGYRGWTEKIGDHILLDFIIFKFLLTSNVNIWLLKFLYFLLQRSSETSSDVIKIEFLVTIFRYFSGNCHSMRSRLDIYFNFWKWWILAYVRKSFGFQPLRHVIAVLLRCMPSVNSNA